MILLGFSLILTYVWELLYQTAQRVTVLDSLVYPFFQPVHVPKYVHNLKVILRIHSGK